MKLTSERRSATVKRGVGVLTLLAACAFALASAVSLLAACGAEDESAPMATTDELLIEYGPTTTEELIFLSDVVARVSLLSAEPGAMLYYGEPAPTFVFRFQVIDYLKGSGDDELTVRVIAEHEHPGSDDYVLEKTPDMDDALRTAESRLAQRDTRWDDREALVFLRSSTVPEDPVVYEFAGRFQGPTWLDDYAVTSADSRAWLPASAPSGDAVADAVIDSVFASSEPQYLTGAPLDTDQPRAQGAVMDSVSSPKSSAASISLSEIESLIQANEDMLAKGESIPGYEECVSDKFKFDALYRNSPPMQPYIIERHIPSGQPEGYRLWTNLARHEGTPFYSRWWTTGADADLFIIRITDDPDNDPTTGYAREEIATRPIPKGNYNVFIKAQPASWVPCDYNPEADTPGFRDMRITVTAPAGTLHEAFFDPAAMGGGAGADGDSGVLKPTALSLADGTSATLRSVKWQPSAVEMRLEPHAKLSGYHADFIALDGSVSLRLDFDDAAETGEGDTRALSWPVCVRPWEDGDLLMLRISESPPGDLPGATRDAACADAAKATPTPTVAPDAPTATPAPDAPTPTAAPAPTPAG